MFQYFWFCYEEKSTSIHARTAAGTIFTHTRHRVKLQYALYHKMMNDNHDFYIHLNNTNIFSPFIMTEWASCELM
jgi:hypothetical protein